MPYEPRFPHRWTLTALNLLGEPISETTIVVRPGLDVRRAPQIWTDSSSKVFGYTIGTPSTQELCRISVSSTGVLSSRCDAVQSYDSRIEVQFRYHGQIVAGHVSKSVIRFVSVDSSATPEVLPPLDPQLDHACRVDSLSVDATSTRGDVAVAYSYYCVDALGSVSNRKVGVALLKASQWQSMPTIEVGGDPVGNGQGGLSISTGTDPSVIVGINEFPTDTMSPWGCYWAWSGSWSRIAPSVLPGKPGAGRVLGAVRHRGRVWLGWGRGMMVSVLDPTRHRWMYFEGEQWAHVASCLDGFGCSTVD